jgi:two-component sensor histidine kinase
MIDQLFSLARGMTSLSEVQAHILSHMKRVIQFAADISRSEVYICARGQNPDMVIILAAAKPSFESGSTYFEEGDAFLTSEFPLVNYVLEYGKKVVGRKELEIGRIVGVTNYPIVDNAGIPFAVVSFMGGSKMQQQVLTDTASLAMQVPLDADVYQPVRPQDGVIILDAIGRIIYANDTASGLYFVLDKEAVENRTFIGHVMVRLPLVEKVMKTGRPAAGEEQAGGLTLSARAIPLMESGQVKRTILLLTDVTAVREKERQLIVKESVIKEIHHRVKNSLNTVAGLLRMQSRRTKNEETRLELRRAVDRIQGISMVHDILAHQSGEDVDWEILLDKLCQLSIHNLAVGHVELRRKKMGKPVMISSEKAVPLAIAVNELIHNAMEHGLEEQEAGTLEVEDQLNEGMLSISIANNGKQLPSNFSSSQYSLGLQIVKNLVEIELHGHFTLENEGTMVKAQVTCAIG